MEELLYSKPNGNKEFMEAGLKMEKSIRKIHLEKVRKLRGCSEIVTRQCGLIIDKDNQRLAGSPDDLSYDHTETVPNGGVEYKYVPSIGARKFTEAIAERKPDIVRKKSGRISKGPKRFTTFPSELSGEDTLKLKENHAHYWQIQLYIKCSKSV